MPSTWDMYGVDANGDGQKDPFNPVDAIFAAARYLRAAGADKDLYRAIFAYNHADWYVESVLMRARVIGGLPTDLVGSLTGLTQGRFPVGAKSTYAGQLPDSETGKRVRARPERRARGRVGRHPPRHPHLQPPGRAGRRRQRRPHHAARPLAPARQLRRAAGHLRQHLPLLGPRRDRQDLPVPARAQGAPRRPRAARERAGAEGPRLALDEVRGREAARREAACGQEGARAHASRPRSPRRRRSRSGSAAKPKADLPEAAPAKERLFAHPTRPTVRRVMRTIESAAAPSPGLSDETLTHGRPAARSRATSSPSRSSAAPASSAGPCSAASARTERRARPNLRFEIRPAGRGAPRIDPKPILDGWKLLESTAIYRSAKRNPFFGADAEAPRSARSC